MRQKTIEQIKIEIRKEIASELRAHNLGIWLRTKLPNPSELERLASYLDLGYMRQADAETVQANLNHIQGKLKVWAQVVARFDQLMESNDPRAD